MARFERTFTMCEQPDQAQTRFRDELGPALNRVGFRLDRDEPGHLVFPPRYMGGVLFLGWVTGIYWLWRKSMNHRLEADFDPAPGGTTVTVYGRTGGGLCDPISRLGRRGHWPENMDDPDWLPSVAEYDLAQWDIEDPREMDRITRRALKKAGRLP
jgi:hypothetical protein